jgi:hypothetical protein
MLGEQVGTIPCCICGVLISSHSVGYQCIACLQTSGDHDVGVNVAKERLINQCRGCLRYETGAVGRSTWLQLAWESREMVSEGATIRAMPLTG